MKVEKAFNVAKIHIHFCFGTFEKCDQCSNKKGLQ